MDVPITILERASDMGVPDAVTTGRSTNHEARISWKDGRSLDYSCSPFAVRMVLATEIPLGP